jgi:hypothetical protein
MSQELVWDKHALPSELLHGMIEINRVPVHDRRRDQAEPRRTEALVFEGAVTDLTLAADSDEVAGRFRDDVARRSEMMSPGWRAPCWQLFFGKLQAGGQSFVVGLERLRLRLSPARSMRWAL